jgi:DNA-binding PadR family transcriptional regulator
MSRDPRPGAGQSPDLPPTAWAVLGLLSFGRELSGYDLKKWADTSLRFFYWSPAISQIYGELRRLDRLGFVESNTAAQDEMRNKRLYRITTEGEDALRTWLGTAPVEPPLLKHGVLLRVWLGHLADPAALHDVVEQHRAYAERMIEELAVSRAVADTTEDFNYPALVVRWGERYYAAERDLADDLLRELDEMNADE